MAELARLAAAATASASRDDFPYEAYGLERDADARARAAAWPDEARRLRRAQKKSLPPFFVYAHGAFNFSNLLGCFHKRHSCEPWACDEHPGMDHVAPEIWATQFLMHHPARVSQAMDAEIFLVPVWPLLSKLVGNACGQGTHDERMRKANAALRGSAHWQRVPGRHFVVAAGPRAQSALGDELRRSLRGSMIANEESWGGLDWCARVIVPYFAHSRLAGAAMEGVLRAELGLPPLRSRGGGRTSEPDTTAPAFTLRAADGEPGEGRMVDFQDVWGTQRHISLYFRGTYSNNAGHELNKKDPKGQDVRVKLIKLAAEIPRSVIKLLPVKSGISRRLLKATEGVPREGRSTAEYAAEIQSAQFCLVPRGDTLTSRRFYDAVLAGCIPIVLSDGMPLPFREELHAQYERAVVSVPLLRFMAAPVSTIRNAIETATLTAGERRHALFELREELRYGSGSPFDARPEFGGAVPHIVRAVHRRATRAAECQPLESDVATRGGALQKHGADLQLESGSDSDRESDETRRVAERTRRDAPALDDEREPALV